MGFIFLLPLYLATAIFFGIFIFIISNTFNLTHKEIVLSPALKFLVVVIFVPIYEEILFRSLLKFKRINIFLFITTLIGLIIICILKSNTKVLAILSFILLSFLVLITSVKRTHIELYISSKFKYFFYSTILIFGLIHAFNFTGNKYAILTFLIILGSPQLVLGAILGYIRMNYGLVYSILFHMIVNSFIIFSIIRGL